MPYFGGLNNPHGYHGYQVTHRELKTCQKLQAHEEDLQEFIGTRYAIWIFLKDIIRRFSCEGCKDDVKRCKSCLKTGFCLECISNPFYWESPTRALDGFYCRTHVPAEALEIEPLFPKIRRMVLAFSGFPEISSPEISPEIQRATVAAAKAEAEAETSHVSKCAICMDNVPTQAFIPCGHLALCESEDCAPAKESGECPVCRTRCIGVYKIHTI